MKGQRADLIGVNEYIFECFRYFDNHTFEDHELVRGKTNPTFFLF